MPVTRMLTNGRRSSANESDAHVGNIESSSDRKWDARTIGEMDKQQFVDGQPEERGAGWARNPELIQRIKQRRQKAVKAKED